MDDIESLKIAKELLFQVVLNINYCKNISKNLPDSFDDQLCDAINDYFDGEK